MRGASAWRARRGLGCRAVTRLLPIGPGRLANVADLVNSQAADVPHKPCRLSRPGKAAGDLGGQVDASHDGHVGRADVKHGDVVGQFLASELLAAVPLCRRRDA